VSVGLFSLNGGPSIIDEILKIWKTRFKVLGWKSFCGEYLGIGDRKTFLECVLDISSGKQHALIIDITIF